MYTLCMTLPIKIHNPISLLLHGIRIVYAPICLHSGRIKLREYTHAEYDVCDTFLKLQVPAISLVIGEGLDTGVGVSSKRTEYAPLVF